MNNKEILELLLPINCRNNQNIIDGECFSATCMMNTNEEVKKKIEEKGCLCFKEYNSEQR